MLKILAAAGTLLAYSLLPIRINHCLFVFGLGETVFQARVRRSVVDTAWLSNLKPDKLIACDAGPFTVGEFHHLSPDFRMRIIFPPYRRAATVKGRIISGYAGVALSCCLALLSGCTLNPSASNLVAANVSISLAPTAAPMRAGAQQQFTATVTGTTNTAVTWSATGGTISSSGLYTAPSTVGDYTVTATSAADTTKSASASVTVSAPVVISVSPTTASIQSGGTQQFTATVTGTSNTAVTWSATAGSISSSGLYTAPSTAGTYTVTATSAADTTKSASATVNVTAPGVSISITPASATLLPGGTQQFTANVSGTSNTGVAWKATGGTVTTTGLYTAPTTAGSYTVTATSVADSTKSALATVTVSSIAVLISPTSASLLTGGTKQFTATVSGTTNTSVNWSTTGGTISYLGYYTAPSTAGTYTVTATSAADTTKSATATVTVSAPIQHTVSLSWTDSSSGVTGYRVYRGTQSGGPYTLLNSTLLSTTSYSDSTVQSGQTYYYVTTAVSTTGVESTYSNQAIAAIPIP